MWKRKRDTREKPQKNSVKKRLLLKFFYAKIATVRYHFAGGHVIYKQ